MTGQELGRHLDTRISQSFTGFLDPTKKNRLFKEALIKLSEDRYKGVPSQKSSDEVDFLIKTNATLTPNSNQFYIAPLQITTVTFVGTAITLSTYLPHNFVVGDTIIVSGLAGFLTNIPNGTFTILTTPTSNSVTYTAGAVPTGAHTANTGIVKGPKILDDYSHLLSLRALFNVRYYDITIDSLTFATPIAMTVDWFSRLRTGSNVVISGATGNTAANATHYLKQLNDTKYSLFSDEFLQVPVAGNGTYGTGAILSERFYEEAKPYFSSTKISALNTPTPTHPRWENAQKLIKIYPLNYVCLGVTIDYMRNPDVVIDVSNATLDLESYYSIDFLYLIADKAAQLYAGAARDREMFNYAIQNEKS